MAIQVDMTREDLIKLVKDSAGAAVAERMQAAEERIKELDGKVAGLNDASGRALGDAWSRGLQVGQPVVVDGDLSDDEIIEQGRQRFFGTRTVKVGGVDYTLSVASKDDVVRQGALFAFRMIRAYAACKIGGGEVGVERAIDVARGWGDKRLAGALEQTRDWQRDLYGTDATKKKEATRALGSHTLGSGAALISPEYASFIIDYRHPKSVVRALVSRLPMGKGGLEIPFMSDAATAEYTGENTGVNASQPEDARLVLARKILQGVIAMSRELVAESDYDVDAFYLQHLAKRMNTREDLALIRGDGTANTPRGMKYWIEQSSAGGEAHAKARTLDTGAVTVSTITDDALWLPQIVEDSDVDLTPDGGAYIMSVRDYYGLAKQRNATTQMEIWPELRLSQFYGYKLRRSPQIPKTLAGDASGTGTGNKSELYFGEMPSFFVADTKILEVNAYDGGTYKDSTGTLQSGITNREIVITADQSGDFGAAERGAEGSMLTSVDWGASA